MGKKNELLPPYPPHSTLPKDASQGIYPHRTSTALSIMSGSENPSDGCNSFAIVTIKGTDAATLRHLGNRPPIRRQVSLPARQPFPRAAFPIFFSLNSPDGMTYSLDRLEPTDPHGPPLFFDDRSLDDVVLDAGFQYDAFVKLEVNSSTPSPTTTTAPPTNAVPHPDNSRRASMHVINAFRNTSVTRTPDDNPTLPNTRNGASQHRSKMAHMQRKRAELQTACAANVEMSRSGLQRLLDAFQSSVDNVFFDGGARAPAAAEDMQTDGAGSQNRREQPFQNPVMEREDAANAAALTDARNRMRALEQEDANRRRAEIKNEETQATERANAVRYSLIELTTDSAGGEVHHRFTRGELDPFESILHDASAKKDHIFNLRHDGLLDVKKIRELGDSFGAVVDGDGLVSFIKSLVGDKVNFDVHMVTLFEIVPTRKYKRHKLSETYVPVRRVGELTESRLSYGRFGYEDLKWETIHTLLDSTKLAFKIEIKPYDKNRDDPVDSEYDFENAREFEMPKLLNCTRCGQSLPEDADEMTHRAIAVTAAAAAAAAAAADADATAAAAEDAAEAAVEVAVEAAETDAPAEEGNDVTTSVAATPLSRRRRRDADESAMTPRRRRAPPPELSDEEPRSTPATIAARANRASARAAARCSAR